MKRLFTGLIGLALAISVFGALAERGGLEAATPLPSGCYTDSSGLPVCGPNYPGPGGTPGPGGVTTVQATATACGAPPVVTNPTPSPIVEVPVCATASPGPSLPLSVANGGTGTAAPAPTSSNGCTVSGTWPSQTFSCPTPGAFSQATPAAGTCIGVSTPPAAGTVTYTCATPTIAPSPTVTATACAASPTVGAGGLISVGTSGCITAGTSCSVSCVGVLLQTGASPTPQAGYAALAGAAIYTGFGALWLGPPAPTASYMPNAVTVQEGSAGCASGDLAAWGTTNATIEGITGDMFSVRCGNGAGGPWFNINTGGATGFYSDMKCCGIGAGHGITMDTGDFLITGAGSFVEWPTSSTTGQPCTLQENASSGFIQLKHTGTGTCTLQFNDVAVSTSTCFNASAAIIGCTVNLVNRAYSTTLTSASGCTALTQCGTVTYNFPTAYAAAPFCSAPGIQDTTTPADLWVGDIDAVSTTAITYSYATLITLVGTKALTVTFTCGAV